MNPEEKLMQMPSARIQEIISHDWTMHFSPSEVQVLTGTLKAIIQYLDEQAKSKSHEPKA